MIARLRVDAVEIPSSRTYAAYLKEDSNWWTVWLGWHPVEMISTGP